MNPLAAVPMVMRGGFGDCPKLHTPWPSPGSRLGPMRPTSTLLAGLALVLALASAVVLIPLWIPLAALSVAVLIREGAIKL